MTYQYLQNMFKDTVESDFPVGCVDDRQRAVLVTRSQQNQKPVYDVHYLDDNQQIRTIRYTP